MFFLLRHMLKCHQEFAFFLAYFFFFSEHVRTLYGSVLSCHQPTEKCQKKNRIQVQNRKWEAPCSECIFGFYCQVLSYLASTLLTNLTPPVSCICYLSFLYDLYWKTKPTVSHHRGTWSINPYIHSHKWNKKWEQRQKYVCTFPVCVSSVCREACNGFTGTLWWSFKCMCVVTYICQSMIYQHTWDEVLRGIYSIRAICYSLTPSLRLHLVALSQIGFLTVQSDGSMPCKTPKSAILFPVYSVTWEQETSHC